VQERVEEIPAPIDEVLAADLNDSYVGQRRRAATAAAAEMWLNVEDEHRFQTLDEQLRQQQDQRRQPEDDEKPHGTACCVDVPRLQRPTDGVVPVTCVGNELN